MAPGPFDFLPLWCVSGLTVALVLLAIELGFRGGRRRRAQADVEGEGAVNVIVAATLGLLAFLLAFTFSQAASFFDVRRNLVLVEANSIGTTFLRAQMLPEGQRHEVRKLLRAYVEVRLAAVQSGQVAEALRRSDEFHRQLWEHAVAVAEKQPGSIVVGLFIQSLNETIDVHAARVSAGGRVRVPASIWAGLYFITIVAMTGLGYHEGLVGRRSYVTLALALAFSAVILLIADLDRPGEGLLRTNQQPLIDLLESMGPV
jgi:hypothetical protein